MYYEGNDLQDMLDTLDNSKIINNYLDDLKFSQNLKFKQKKLDELNNINIKKQLDYHQERERRKTKYQILRFIRLDKTKDTLKKIIKPEEEKIFNENDYLKFKNVLSLSKTLAKENGSKIHFIYLPSYKRLKGSSSEEENNQKKQVLSIIKDLDISLIDIEAEILLKKIEYLKIFPFGMYGHYNIDGYRIISNIIYDKIIN